MAVAASATDLPLKIITGADAIGASLKDAMVSHLRSLGIDVEDTGVSSYYSAGSEVGRRVSASSSSEIRGLVCCGTGVGVAMFANKFPGVYAATCLTVEDAVNARSISNSNVLALSGIKTSPENAMEIFDAWIKTPFKSPCPASGSEPWCSEISSFLDNSLSEMLQIGKPTADSTTYNFAAFVYECMSVVFDKKVLISSHLQDNMSIEFQSSSKLKQKLWGKIKPFSTSGRDCCSIRRKHVFNVVPTFIYKRTNFATNECP